MKVVVLGAGIIGVSTAWHLLEQGHEVVVVDRQPEAAMETSFANGAQISVSFCEPWANAGAPLKVAKWLLRDDSPLLFRPRLDPHQWRWGLAFLGQCTHDAFERNVRQLVALGRYSHDTLKEIVASTGIEYQRLERGILHFFSSQADLDAGAAGAQVMRRHGVDRRVLDRQQVLAIEPALASYGPSLAGGTYTPSDESGDARVFTQRLAERCAGRGAQFLHEHQVLGLDLEGGAFRSVRVVRAGEVQPTRVHADAVVVAMGSYSAPMLRTVGVSLNIYPAKGYSATFKLRDPARASVVSLLDDSRKIAISRLGDQIRVAGTAELAGYDTDLDGPTARVRCESLRRRYEELFPGVADTTEPNYWTGLRPSTPDNIPCMGRTAVPGVWVNAGHGTLGWTHGAGSGRALADLISGRRPELDFNFLASPAGVGRARVATA
ncbi:glycine/D-amino acid oxidase-like deaminating enzyme [Sphaerotilus hippei]|uniref:Glycine/D-amino acid oxidase-like deaminating enzyme n=1 Tax=Sphaerotilus hippei TaxID=744406 RepID=A0A318H5Q0_9BURK|nr:D-amino acid dehydrogenase [Sphaerotilus hippei]PXW96680.1 glycine/D-amino acid oxidase-like deaminating enzyme [Sphaerotilus hippei]